MGTRCGVRRVILVSPTRHSGSQIGSIGGWLRLGIPVEKICDYLSFLDKHHVFLMLHLFSGSWVEDILETDFQQTETGALTPHVDINQVRAQDLALLQSYYVTTYPTPSQS